MDREGQGWGYGRYRQSIGVLKITYGYHPPSIKTAPSGTLKDDPSYFCKFFNLHWYLWAGWRNQLESFFKWKVRSGRSQWNHLGFLISIPGVRNILQSQEVFLMDAKSNFFNFEDRDEWFTSNCMFLKEKSICVLKITYGHHHPYIRKALTGSLKDDQI